MRRIKCVVSYLPTESENDSEIIEVEENLTKEEVDAIAMKTINDMLYYKNIFYYYINLD